MKRRYSREDDLRSLIGSDYIDLRFILHATEPAKTIVAWTVRGDNTDTEYTWAIACLLGAQAAKRPLILLDPILENDDGSWPYELFKQKGCDHCHPKLWRRLAAPITIVENAQGECYMRDLKGNVLAGLKDVNTTQFPLRIPENWDLLPRAVAEIIKASIEEGTITPIFKRRR